MNYKELSIADLYAAKNFAKEMIKDYKGLQEATKGEDSERFGKLLHNWIDVEECSIEELQKRFE